MSFPPHLPAPSCNIITHRKWQRIKILSAAAVFGLAAGLSGAAIMLGWIWPGWGGGDDWMVSRVNNSWLSRTQLEERVRLEMVDRVAEVYARASNLRGVNYFSNNDKVGEAMVVTSDGWLVMYFPGSIAGYKYWQVLLNDEVYKVTNILTDQNAGLVYFKLAENKQPAGRDGTQFKVVSFENNLVQAGDEVYVLQNNDWQYAIVKQLLPKAISVPHLDSAPVARYSLNINVLAGEIVIDKSGKSIGVVAEDGSVLPARYISRVLSGVLERKIIFYPSFGLEGWFSFEQPIAVGIESLKGFLVTKGSGEIRSGDVIVEINGQIVNEDNLWYNLNTTSAVRVKVSRMGKILEVELKRK
jgi:hypothetical protein